MSCDDSGNDSFMTLCESIITRETLNENDKISLNKICEGHRFSALLTAMKFNKPGILRELLDLCKETIVFTPSKVRELFTYCIHQPHMLDILYNRFTIPNPPQMTSLDRPMLIAIKYSIIALLDKLLKNPEYRKPVNEWGEGLVHVAVTVNNVDMVVCLQNHEFDFNAKSNVGWTPLRVALYYQFPTMVTLLLNMDIDRDESNIATIQPHLEPILISTLREGLTTTFVKILLNSNCNPNVLGQNHSNCLQVLDDTYDGERVELAKLLVKKGININHVNGEGRTPLDSAIHLGDFKLFRYLRSIGARSIMGNPIHSAVLADNVHIMVKLINLGYNKDEEVSNPKNPEVLYSPLSIAILNGSLNCLHVLIALQPTQKIELIPVLNDTIEIGAVTMGQYCLLQFTNERYYTRVIKELKIWDKNNIALKYLEKGRKEVQNLEGIKLEGLTMRQIIQLPIKVLAYKLISRNFRNSVYNTIMKNGEIEVYRDYFLFKLYCAKVFYQYYLKQLEIIEETIDVFGCYPGIRSKIAYYSTVHYKLRYHLEVAWESQHNFEFLKE